MKGSTKKKLTIVFSSIVGCFLLLALFVISMNSALFSMFGVDLSSKTKHTFYNIADTNLSSVAANKNYSTVYMTKYINPKELVSIYEALGRSAKGNVAVKISTGEAGNPYYLKPDLIKDLVKKVNGTIVECNTAYAGRRTETAIHMQVAKDHGFTNIANVDIMDSEGSMSLPVKGGTYLKQDLVGSHLAKYNFVVVLSHFKGHDMAGFGGALKNTSIGIGSKEGKCLIHTSGANSTNFVAWGANQNGFLDSMAEAAKAVSDYESKGKNVLYINVLNNLSVDCDCVPNPAEPQMADIGIVASTDPVAVDQASVDLIYKAKDGQSVINRIESRNGLELLKHAEEIGLGNRAYKLVNID